MTTLRKIIENEIESLDDFACFQNNEGREREAEKYRFAKEYLEELYGE